MIPRPGSVVDAVTGYDPRSPYHRAYVRAVAPRRREDDVPGDTPLLLDPLCTAPARWVPAGATQLLHRRECHRCYRPDPMPAHLAHVHHPACQLDPRHDGRCLVHRDDEVAP